MQEFEDAKLVQIAMRGTTSSRSACDALVQRHKDWLYTYLLHLLRDRGMEVRSAHEE